MPRSLLEISRELESLAQAGLTYSKDPFERERCARLRELAEELIQTQPGGIEFKWPPASGYTTPKIDIRALVIRNGEILLVQERESGKWSAPGGWADVNLTPAENAAKECREEAGVEIAVDRLVAVIDRDRAGHPPIAYAVYKLYFLCTPVSGEPKAGFEVADARFFPQDALPEIDTQRISLEDIRRGFACRENPALPVYFQPLKRGEPRKSH